MDQSNERGSSSSDARGSMMIRTALQTAMHIWRTALATRPGHLIDKVLDWMEELSITMMPVEMNGLACIEVRADRMREH